MLTEVGQCDELGGSQPPTLFSLEWVVCTNYSLLSSHRIVIPSLLSPKSVRSLPSPCLCLSCLPVRRHSTAVSHIRHMAGFQNSKFYEPIHHELALLLWRRISLCFCDLLVRPTKVLAQLHNGSKFMVILSKNTEPSLLSSASVPVPILMNKATH